MQLCIAVLGKCFRQWCFAHVVISHGCMMIPNDVAEGHRFIYKLLKKCISQQRQDGKSVWGRTKLLCGQINQNLKFFLGTIDVMSCRLKRNGPSSLLSADSLKAYISDGMKCSVCSVGNLHTWKGTINTEENREVLRQHILPSKRLSGKALHISARQC